jgi:hypothetical protein
MESFAALSISPPRSPLHDLRLRKPIAASSQNDAIAFQKNKTIASHPPQQKEIAHFSKTNLIALLINHKAIASLLPQEKRSPISAKQTRSPSKPTTKRSHLSHLKKNDRYFSRKH